MTRKILFAVIFTAAVVFSFSFSSRTAPNVSSTPKSVKKYVTICLNVASCSFCGSVSVTSSSTTICLHTNCSNGPGTPAHFCVQWSTTFNVILGRYEVDANSITIQYSSPQLKAQVNEAALKADFIQQMNAALNS